MSESVIRVENLGKHFIIGHEKTERYTALRDVITNNVKGAVRRTGNMLRGKFASDEGTTEEFWALKDLNFEIKQGDRVGIIGRNGAGKSTLLKVLSRITEPTHGRISIRGRVASLLEVGTGFHPELSGRENIFLNGAILGMGRSEIRKKFDEIVEFAEVERFLDTPVKRYSSGMYVRLAFAVAAHLEPEILIVDEVLAVGDAQFQKKCLGKMEDVSKNDGRTVLFVSHNMGVIAQLCSQAIYLKSGQIVEQGPTKRVIDRYILNNSDSSNLYVAPDKKRSGQIFFDQISTVNAQGIISDNYQFDEHIFLKVSIIRKEYNPGAKVSVTLQSNTGDYLSTFVEDLSSLPGSDGQKSDFLIKLPARLIAPNAYAFRFAVFVPSGPVYDLVEMICPIRVFDNGTPMALFEGTNYGSFFMQYEIQTAVS